MLVATSRRPFARLARATRSGIPATLRGGSARRGSPTEARKGHEESSLGRGGRSRTPKAEAAEAEAGGAEGAEKNPEEDEAPERNPRAEEYA